MSREVDLGQIVPNIQVGTTTTGLPSTPASVENVGTDLNPIFDFTIPKGNTGATPNIQIGDVQTGDSSEVTRTGTDENPILNFTLEKGDTGNGIASIAKTSTSGLVDTYTITFTNGQTTTFEVTNGANGDVVDVQVDGTSVVDNGVANIVGLAEMKQELEDMYNLLPKVSGTGETITLDGTVAGKMLVDLKGNTSQEGTPTPESPQDIHVVSGENNIEVCGKNLVFSKIANENISRNGLLLIDNYFDMHIARVTQGETYTISTNDATNGFVGGFFYDLPMHNMFTYDNQRVVQDNNKTFTAPITGYVAFRSQAGYEYAQLEKGNQATTYEAYKGASYPINLGDIELCKIGDYQDSIVKDNGKWYLNKQIGKVVLDGSEAWNTSGKTYYINISAKRKLTSSSSNGLISNYFKDTTATSSANVGLGEMFEFFNPSVPNNNVGFNYDDAVGGTSTFKTWLSSNNVEVRYVLATPTYTEITDSTLLSQLNALARSYLGQTNITQTNNDLPFIINATALKEMA